MLQPGRAQPPVAPGDVVGGKFRVERVLGAGGMGVVVAARHLELDQSVALKFIAPEALSGDAAVERFLREARAAVRLKSEHVARVFDVGRDQADRPYMVLELLEGMDLAKLAAERGPLPVADAVEYVLQACDALVEAHAIGIVHRDLKPQNMFVTRRLNGTPLVKVLDFGIAKAVGPAAVGQMALTDSSAIIGSPLYMAPEQMRSARAADPRSDVWALGVILYELLGGQLPFDGETVTEICIRVVNEEPARLVELRPGLDAKLVDVVMRCLEKDPEDRWQKVAQLAAEIEPFSRSGKHGGVVRAWRSFEDTGDVQDRAVLGGAPVESAPPIVTAPPPSRNADASSGSLPTLSPEVRSSAPAGRARAGMSTDVTWGNATPPATARPRSSRSFAKGAIAGACLAMAATALAAIVARRAPAPVAIGHAASVETPPVVAPSAFEHGPSPVSVALPAPAFAATTALPSAASTASTAVARGAASAPPRAAKPGSAMAASPTRGATLGAAASVRAAAPPSAMDANSAVVRPEARAEPEPTATPANGAPILR